VSVGVGGGRGNGHSYFSAVSPDGRYVGFVSDATNLVAKDSNLTTDTFVRDMATKTTYRVNVTNDGTQAGTDLGPPAPTISRGGIVAFVSEWPLLAADTNVQGDIYVRAVP
jgi:hypothetical protein